MTIRYLVAASALSMLFVLQACAVHLHDGRRGRRGAACGPSTHLEGGLCVHNGNGRGNGRGRGHGNGNGNR